MSKQSFTTGQVLTAAQVNSLQANDYNQTVSVKTANYTLAAADKGTRIEFNTSGSVTCTVNSGLFDAGDTLVIQNRGAGAATVTAGTATVNTSASLVVKQYDSGVLYFVSDSSAIYFASDAADTPLTTKGDLFTFSTAADRLAVGNNGETLVADSSTATGLRYQGHIEAGKNFLINGGFDIWQRGTSSTASSTYATADRWFQLIESGSGTWAQETTVKPTGATYSLKFTASATSSIYPIQAIESINATRLAGKTVVFSGQVAASTSTAMSMIVSHSSSVDVAPGGTWTNLTAVSGGTATPTSTTFVPISGVYDIPSTAKSIRVIIRTTSTIANGVVVYWGNQQLEIGSVATEFSRAGGNIAGELAACQRYYVRMGANSGGTAEVYSNYGSGYSVDASNITAFSALPVQMRVRPTAIEYANLAIQDFAAAVIAVSALTLNTSQSSFTVGTVNGTVSGSTAARGCKLLNNNNNAGYLAFSAEL